MLVCLFSEDAIKHLCYNMRGDFDLVSLLGLKEVPHEDWFVHLNFSENCWSAKCPTRSVSQCVTPPVKTIFLNRFLKNYFRVYMCS